MRWMMSASLWREEPPSAWLANRAAARALWAGRFWAFSHQEALESMEKLRGVKASLYLAAHRGVYESLDPWIDRNIALIRRLSREILALIDRPMTLGEVQTAVCEHYHLLTSNVSRAGLYERNIRIYAEYLRDTGAVDVEARRGILYYCPKEGGETR